jgi:hypothetical protein
MVNFSIRSPKNFFHTLTKKILEIFFVTEVRQFINQSKALVEFIRPVQKPLSSKRFTSCILQNTELIFE